MIIINYIEVPIRERDVHMMLLVDLRLHVSRETVRRDSRDIK